MRRRQRRSEEPSQNCRNQNYSNQNYPNQNYPNQNYPPPPPPPGIDDTWELQYCKWWGWNWVKKDNCELETGGPRYFAPPQQMLHRRTDRNANCFKDFCNCLFGTHKSRGAESLQRLYSTPSNSIVGADIGSGFNKARGGVESVSCMEIPSIAEKEFKYKHRSMDRGRYYHKARSEERPYKCPKQKCKQPFKEEFRYKQPTKDECRCRQPIKEVCRCRQPTKEDCICRQPIKEESTSSTISQEEHCCCYSRSKPSNHDADECKCCKPSKRSKRCDCPSQAKQPVRRCPYAQTFESNKNNKEKCESEICHCCCVCACQDIDASEKDTSTSADDLPKKEKLISCKCKKMPCCMAHTKKQKQSKSKFCQCEPGASKEAAAETVGENVADNQRKKSANLTCYMSKDVAAETVGENVADNQRKESANLTCYMFSKPPAFNPPLPYNQPHQKQQSVRNFVDKKNTVNVGVSCQKSKGFQINSHWHGDSPYQGMRYDKTNVENVPYQYNSQALPSEKDAQQKCCPPYQDISRNIANMEESHQNNPPAMSYQLSSYPKDFLSYHTRYMGDSSNQQTPPPNYQLKPPKDPLCHQNSKVCLFRDTPCKNPGIQQANQKNLCSEPNPQRKDHEITNIDELCNQKVSHLQQEPQCKWSSFQDILIGPEYGQRQNCQGTTQDQKGDWCSSYQDIPHQNNLPTSQHKNRKITKLNPQSKNYLSFQDQDPYRPNKDTTSNIVHCEICPFFQREAYCKCYQCRQEFRDRDDPAYRSNSQKEMFSKKSVIEESPNEQSVSSTSCRCSLCCHNCPIHKKYTYCSQRTCSYQQLEDCKCLFCSKPSHLAGKSCKTSQTVQCPIKSSKKCSFENPLNIQVPRKTFRQNFEKQTAFSKFRVSSSGYEYIHNTRSDILDKIYSMKIDEEFKSPVSGKIYDISSQNHYSFDDYYSSTLPDPIDVEEDIKYLQSLEKKIKTELKSRILLDVVCDAVLFRNNAKSFETETFLSKYSTSRDFDAKLSKKTGTKKESEDTKSLSFDSHFMEKVETLVNKLLKDSKPEEINYHYSDSESNFNEDISKEKPTYPKRSGSPVITEPVKRFKQIEVLCQSSEESLVKQVNNFNHLFQKMDEITKQSRFNVAKIQGAIRSLPSPNFGFNHRIAIENIKKNSRSSFPNKNDNEYGVSINTVADKKIVQNILDIISNRDTEKEPSTICETSGTTRKIFDNLSDTWSTISSKSQTNNEKKTSSAIPRFNIKTLNETEGTESRKHEKIGKKYKYKNARSKIPIKKELRK